MTFPEDNPLLARTPASATVLLAVISWLLVSAPAGAEEGKQGASPEPAVTYKIVQQGREDLVWKISIIGAGFKGLVKPVRLRMESWGRNSLLR